MKRASTRVLACMLLWGLGAGTAALEAAPWRFAATCDSRGSSRLQEVNTNVLREIALAIVDEAVELVVFAGDLVYGYPGTTAAFTEWTNAMAPLYEAGIGVYPVRGNHDIGTTGWQEVLGHRLPSNGPPGEIGMTFAFTNRNALFLGLDNYSGSLDYFSAPIAVDADWVQQQLASNTLPHVFAYGHSPAFKVLHWDCLDDVRPARDAMWRSLSEAGAKVYFCGHDHFYDHSRVDDGDGNPVNDMHQYVAGTAGAPLYDQSPYNGDNGPWTPIRVFFDRTHGYVIGEIDGPRVTMTWKRREAPGVYVAAETFRYDVEATAPRTRYVSPHGLHVEPFDDWTTAATTIQAAVEVSVDWDTVLVTNGTYDSGGSEMPNGIPSRVAVSRDVEVRSVHGPSATTIVGQGPSGSNAVRCAYVGGNGRLTGFTLRDGHTHTNGSVNLAMSGGGLWCEGKGTVTDCVITGNEAAALGGGAYVAGGRLVNCVVHRNRAQHGGGAFCWQGGVLSHCTVSGNDVTATLLGGGGGVHLYGGGSVVNSVVHLNRGHINANWHTHQGGSIGFTCTAPLPAPTCVTETPGFAAAHAGNYRLTIGSPCIDRAAPVLTERMDIDHTPRPLDGNADGTGIADMGAYEFVHAAADTDGDMLLDFDEIDLFHTNPTLGDTDGDRMGDGREVRAGTDPLDSDSLLRITQCRVLTNAPNTLVQWQAVAGRRYGVYRTTNLLAGGWRLLDRVTAGVSGPHTYTNGVADSAVYYRVAVEPQQP